MLSVMKYAFVGLVGVASGMWIGQQGEVSEPKIEQTRTIEQTRKARVKIDSTTAADLGNGSPALISQPFSVTPPATTDDSNDVAINERPKALEFIDDISMDSYGSPQFIEASAKFGEWLASSEHPARDIRLYVSSSAHDDQKYLLEYLISAKYHAGLDLDIVRELSSAPESQVEEWESILKLVPISSTEGRDALMNVLPSLDNSALVAASISAVGPRLISPAERDTLLSRLSTYAYSDDETVRTAALGTLGSWSATDYSYVFEEALSDDDKIPSVLSAVNSGTFITPSMQSQLFTILRDSSKPMHVRRAVFGTLAHAQLSEEEYWQYYEFSKNHVESVSPQ